MPVRSMLLVSLDRFWQPCHWLTPVAVGSKERSPACGKGFDLQAPACHRYLERGKVHLLTCPDCRRLFRQQEALTRRKRRL